MLTSTVGTSGSSRLQIVLATSSSLCEVPCHQDPRSMEFLVVHLFLEGSTASFRHPIQLFLSGFGGIAIYHNNVRRTKSLAPFLENGVEVLCSTKTLELQTPPQRPKRTPHEATRVALPEMGSCVDDLNIRQDRTPDFTLVSFI